MKPAPSKLSQVLSYVLVGPMAALVFTFSLCAPSLSAQTQSFTSFDAPGAGTSEYEGTFASAINKKGAISGYFVDNSKLRHGFVRQPGGQFAEFNTPYLLNGPIVLAMNDRGDVLGTGTVPNPFSKVAFLHHPAGHDDVFAPVGAINTIPLGLDNKGDVVGYFEDANSIYHGFVRDSRGNITVIDNPDANLSGGNGTFASAINDKGQIAGFYNDKNTGNVRGFVLEKSGQFTNFDAVPDGSAGMHVSAINSAGEVAGQYWNNVLETQGFLRDAAGNVTDFAVTGTSLTVVTGLNDAGVTAGVWDDSQLYQQTFERNADGNITTLSAPDFNYGTVAAGVNDRGVITGYWTDLTYVSHGFIHE